MASGGSIAQQKPFRVTVDIVPKAAIYVREHIWSPDQVITPKKDGGLALEFNANSRVVVLSYGGKAVLRGLRTSR